jgi:hypothetical protein
MSHEVTLHDDGAGAGRLYVQLDNGPIWYLGVASPFGFACDAEGWACGEWSPEDADGCMVYLPGFAFQTAVATWSARDGVTVLAPLGAAQKRYVGWVEGRKHGRRGPVLAAARAEGDL